MTKHIIDLLKVLLFIGFVLSIDLIFFQQNFSLTALMKRLMSVISTGMIVAYLLKMTRKSKKE